MSWWRWGGIPARVWLKLDDGSDTGQLIFGSSYDTRFPTSVYEYDPDYPDDYLNDIPYYIETPYYDAEEPWSIKRFTFVNIDFDDYNGGITVEWTVDDGLRSGSFEANVPSERTSSYGSSSDVTAVYNNSSGTTVNGAIFTKAKSYSLTFKLPKECRGRRIKFKLSADASGFRPGKFNIVSFGFRDIGNLFPQGAR